MRRPTGCDCFICVNSANCDECTVDQGRGLFISLCAILVAFGVLMVHSASITSRPTEFEQIYLSRHVVYLGCGILAATVCALLPVRFWYRWSGLLFAGCVVLLVLVLIPGIGARVNGAQRWLRYGPLSLQPSELVKIMLPIYICRVLTQRRDELKRWFGGIVPVAFPVGMATVLVFVQPDFGTAVFLAAGCAIALFAAGWPLRHFILCGGLGVPALAMLVALKPYQVERITGYLAAWSDFNQAPYQLKQALVTLGAGGLAGVGLGKGWQKLSFLPEANTDFVFAVVGEELGLIGTLSLLLVWATFYLTGLRLLEPLAKRGFAAAVGFTLLTQLVLQAALNMAVVTALVPPKGIPHPLLSYGGTNLLVSLMAVGIIIGIARDGEAFDAEIEEELAESRRKVAADVEADDDQSDEDLDEDTGDDLDAAAGDDDEADNAEADDEYKVED